jgi:hypothetical protein
MSALGEKQTLQSVRPMSALPPKADIVECEGDVRFVPKADIVDLYSISSSASDSTDGGIAKPAALAVVRFMTSSNFVGSTTGRSATFVPVRILST